MRCSQRGQGGFEEEGKAETHPVGTGASSCSTSKPSGAPGAGHPWLNLCQAETGVRDEAERCSRQRIFPFASKGSDLLKLVPAAAGEIGNNATVGCKEQMENLG